ncbi:MAG: cation acetate symporter [Ilumatobacteraceae bacterium]
MFVAAPLRRLGERSIPDFLARRYRSEVVRQVAVVITELVILAYLLPQAVGAGLAWELLGQGSLPGLSQYGTGIVVSTVLVASMVVIGGMRGTTWNQALQFVVLVGILTWLVLAVLSDGFSYGAEVARLSAEPLQGLTAGPDGVPRVATVVSRITGEPARFSDPGARYGAFGQVALVVTLVFGTTGLPHVMNRFLTSPSGRAALMTAVWVVGLVGGFYSMAVLLGTAARSLIPGATADHAWLRALTIDGVLEVPEYALISLGRLFGGDAGLSVVTTGAVIAIMSTVAGLLLAASATWGNDVYERWINPAASRRQALAAGRVAVGVLAVVSAVLGLLLDPDQLTGSIPSVIAGLVTAAFGIAGSTLAPVIVIGIWWPRATAHGAVAAMVVGFATSTVSIGFGLFSDSASSVLTTPTIVSGTLAILVMVVVSRLTQPTTDVDGCGSSCTVRPRTGPWNDSRR